MNDSVRSRLPRPVIVVLDALRLYVVTFAVAGGLFGLMWGLLFGSVSAGLEQGVTCGVLMSVFLGTAAVVGHRGRGGRISPRRELVVRLDADRRPFAAVRSPPHRRHAHRTRAVALV
jgi:hypothetical protein